MTTPRSRVSRWCQAICVVASLAVIGLAAGPARSADPAKASFAFFQPVQPPRPVQVIAHRGMAQAAPENTRRALEMCVEDFVEWAEIDVRLSKDHQHVICHDAVLDRTTSGHGPVADQAAANLLALDAGSWFSRRFAAERLLSLEKVLKLAKGRLNLCLDCQQIDVAQLAREILAAGMEQQVVVYTDPANLKRLREASGGKVPGMTQWRPQFGLENWIADVRPAAVEIDADQVTADACQKFHDSGIKVEAKTLGAKWDRPEVWDRLVAAGVDWIQTDAPAEAEMHLVRTRLGSLPVKISCHRGANRYAPENTIAAFAKAIALGVDYVEFDVRPSKDGKFFILHDSTLNRTTNGTGPIRKLDAVALAKLDAGSWFGKPFAGAPLPTLDSTLATLRDHAQAYFDAKDIDPAKIVEFLVKYEMLDRSVVYQSPAFLAKLKALNPRVRPLPALRRADQLDAIADRVRPYGVDTDWRALSRELIERAHRRGILVFSDAFGSGDHETIEDYQRAIGWGIDVIQTNHPARVLRAVELMAKPEARP